MGGGQALQIGFLFNHTFPRHDIQEVIVPEPAAVPQDLRSRWLAHPNAYFFRLDGNFDRRDASAEFRSAIVRTIALSHP
jgi:hypothetical protein